MGAFSFCHTEGGATSFHSLKGRSQKVLSCLLDGGWGGGGVKVFRTSDFPLPVINDQSLIEGLSFSNSIDLHNRTVMEI